jgi:hypothetical protein
MNILKLFTMLPIDVLSLVQRYWSDSGLFVVTKGDRLISLQMLLKERTTISYSLLRESCFSCCMEVDADAKTLGYNVEWTTMNGWLTACFWVG